MEKFYFSESTIENPVKFFEFALSQKGQVHLKKEFLSISYDPDFPQPEFDLEKECLVEDYYDYEDDETTRVEYWYRDFVAKKFFTEKNKSISLFSTRLDNCNTAADENYVLKKFQRILYRLIKITEKNAYPLEKNISIFLSNFINDLEKIHGYRTGLSSISLEQSVEEKLKKIIEDLSFIKSADNDNFLHFLLCNDINSVTSKIQVLCDNRQFHYILYKFISIGYPVSFGMTEIIKSEIFLRESDGNPFTASNFYNVSSKNKSTTPKKAKEIDKVFSQF
jgi:hypothetical protein